MESIVQIEIKRSTDGHPGGAYRPPRSAAVGVKNGVRTLVRQLRGPAVSTRAPFRIGGAGHCRQSPNAYHESCTGDEPLMLASLNFASWNRIAEWPKSVQHLRAVA
jgi:hypothetical protein